MLNVSATTPNTTPSLNEKNTLQDDLDALNLTVTVSVDDQVSINGLFADAENDAPMYAVTDVNDNGLSVITDNENAELHIIGTPKQTGVA